MMAAINASMTLLRPVSSPAAPGVAAATMSAGRRQAMDSGSAWPSSAAVRACRISDAITAVGRGVVMLAVYHRGWDIGGLRVSEARRLRW